jgi:5-methylcytosine-specific restriction endonuclease McrA
MVHYLGNPCKRGHNGKRFVSNAGCVECITKGYSRYRKKYEQSQKYKSAKLKYNRSSNGKASLKARGSKHRASHRGIGGNFTVEDERKLRERQKKCHICGRRFTMKDPATLDHVIPITKRGPHDPGNLALAHKSCNSRKGNRRTHLI